MKALGEAALDLPWLPPCAASLVALTRTQPASIWKQVRGDPGAVALLLRACTSSDGAPLAALPEPGVLALAQDLLHTTSTPLTDWRRPGLYRVLQVALQQARLAAELALQVPRCDVERAWVAGLLTPLAWFGIAVCAPEQMSEHLAKLVLHQDAAAWQCERWGLDAAALTRRLARHWRLPAWLTPVLGHLGLHINVAERLGAEPKLFQTVQLAVSSIQQRELGLRLPVGSHGDELAAALGLAMSQVEPLVDKVLREPVNMAPDEGAAASVLLGDVLRLAGEQRRQQETLVRLQDDLDHLQQALEHQTKQERDRLQGKKLSALAELAAGAGHEINNPLAVISGQAQYLLKQIELADEQLVEDPSPTLYLDTLKSKLNKALATIVGQAQRIHHVLTDLMQFAKPPMVRAQTIAATRIVNDAVTACQHVARERQVRLVSPDAPPACAVVGDLGQLRTALANLLRNALEAAPADGWAGVRVEACDGRVHFIVEDNGPGPAPALREHLFDPFFSGRSAGRGRGLGLPTAWRLAQHNGGDVYFAAATSEATRFVMSLPAAPEPAPANGNGHYETQPRQRNGAHAAANA
jgi:two-component system NtrC family sensor kinase